MGFNLIPINSSPSDKKSSHLGGNRRIPSFNLRKKGVQCMYRIEVDKNAPNLKKSSDLTGLVST